MGEVGDAYAGCRQRITELTAALGDHEASRPVLACPKWSVHDVVAHLAGIVDDGLAGRIDGVATEPWTAAQVDARRDRSLPDILAEWNEKAPEFEALLDAIGDMGRQGVADVVTHEHDIRGALQRPGSRSSEAVLIGVGFVAPMLVGAAGQANVAFRVRCTGGMEFGPDAPEVELAGEPFALLRAMTGRRSVEQLREMEWSGDPDGVIPSFTIGPFRPSAHRIDE